MWTLPTLGEYPVRKSLPSETITIQQFLIGAGVFEGLLLLVALGLGALVGVHPTQQLIWSWDGFLLGLAATGPMLLFFAAAWMTTIPSFREIREFLRDVLGPALHQCRLIDLLGLALLAGICEEVLFRGLIWQYVNGHNAVMAVIVTNVLFGLAHSVTPLYAWLAGLIGLYLTALMALGREPNLLIPMTAHTAYDFIAFLAVRRDFRRHQAEAEADAGAGDGDGDGDEADADEHDDD